MRIIRKVWNENISKPNQPPALLKGEQMTEEMLKLYANPEIQSRRGPWQVGDKYWCKEHGIIFYPSRVCYAGNEGLIWLPPDSSYEQLERSLWGMLEGRKELIEFQPLSKMTNNFVVTVRGNDTIYIGTGKTPTEALLRAIWEQKGGSDV